MNHTKIEWDRNQDGSQGFTSNPVRGECPVGCLYCYVKPFRVRYGWHKDIRFYPSELEAISKRKKPAGIFVGSTIELFHDKTIQYMPEIMDIIRDCPQHRFYLLTKQPQNLSKFSPFPDNVYLGVSATNQHQFDEAVKYLKEVEAKVKYISFEPLLNWWDTATSDMVAKSLKVAGVNWVIIGAQTKPYKPPKIEWVQEIVQACDKAKIPVFLKDNLRPLLNQHRVWEWEWAISPNRKLRQEVPRCVS